MARSRPAPPDQKHRDRIAAELDTTMLVEAAAGTGKTTCLIGRMVGLVRAGKCGVESIAAVTFTRKAAAELRTRFQLALEKAARNAVGHQGQRLTHARDHVERCFIGTIHAFCARLLRERPVEAGVDPGFVELDELSDAQLRQQAWREHVGELVATNNPILPELERLGLKVSAATRRSSSLASELDELGLEPAELGPAFLAYAEFSDVDAWPAPAVPLPDLAECRTALIEYTAHMQAVVVPADCGNDTLMPKYERIGRIARRFDLDQPAQLMELLEQFEGSIKVVQKMWPQGAAYAKAEQKRWQAFVEQHAGPLLLAWREHRYEPVMRAIRPARDAYDRLRRERNALNFQDLLLAAAAMLRDNPEIRRYFRDRFTHLLVDEFQDTDPIQAEVMLLLTADDCTETRWQHCRPVPGALFVVGDPKQSIYRFRRADILTYGKVRAIIERAGGEVIPLSANFRSVRPLVEWVNRCSSGVFPPAADDYNPADRPLEVGRLAAADETPAIRRLVVPEGFRTDENVAQYEADLIARTIRRAIDEQWPVARSGEERALGRPEHAEPGDFLIVTMRRKRLAIFARRLQRYGLPHAVTGGTVLNDVPELRLLQTCLTALVRTDDPLALVAVLRSELFGVSDTVLYDLRRLGGRFSFRAEIPGELPEAGAAVLRDAWARMQAYHRWLHQMPAPAAIERIAADLGLVARACAAEEGDAHAGSFLKAIELLRRADDPLTIGDFTDALTRIVDQTDQHDGVPVRPPAQMPVRVMNLHQVKGLEAPWVFLADASGLAAHDVGVHIDRSSDTPRGFLPIYGLRRSQWGRPPLLAQPAGWRDLAAEEQRFLDAEANRLLYVAATRAGSRLVISQRAGSGNRKNPWRFFDAFLASAPPLADPGSIPARTPPPAVAIDRDAWDGEVRAIERRWQAVLESTYAVVAIKQTALEGGGFKPHGAEPGGAQWGDVLHTLLETAMRCPAADLRRVALAALADEELPAALADDVVTTVERVMASDLWQRARRAARCLTEVPLALPASAGGDSRPLPTVERGVIDLVFSEDSGAWVIVDYKSERVDRAAIAALVEYYRPQIDAYADAWQRAVGQRVVERGLFFTHTGRYERLG